MKSDATAGLRPNVFYWPRTLPGSLLPFRFSWFLALIIGSAAGWVGQYASAETTNLQIVPNWTDDDHFWFERTGDDGQQQTVDVDAADGTLTVRSGEEKSDDPDGAGLIGGPVPWSGLPMNDDIEIKFVNQTDQPVTAFWVDGEGKRVKYHTLSPGETRPQHTYVGHSWEVIGENGDFYGSMVASRSNQVATVDKKYEKTRDQRANRFRSFRKPDSDIAGDRQLRIENGRLESRPSGLPETDEGIDEDVVDDRSARLDSDSEWQSVESVNKLIRDDSQWQRFDVSPDGKFVALWMVERAEDLKVHTIESSPAGGGRAVLHSNVYPLPGDEFDKYSLTMLRSDGLEPISVELPVFDFGRPRIHWYKDHRMAIEKVDRGHQRFRLFVINPDDESVGTPIDEVSDTFIWTAHGPEARMVSYLEKSDQVIYSSERSGWRHLYLVGLDASEESEAVMQPITKGDFLIREIDFIDEDQGYVDAVIGEYYDQQDPYHQHLARFSLDGKSMTVLTDGDGDHRYQFSPDRRYLIASHSRVDSPPVHELRRVSDGEKLATLATAKKLPGKDSDDESASSMPTVFSAKGRDGETDIWGLICFPKDYDPDSPRQYPVIEAIYAGPHGSHVPKSYRDQTWHSDLTEMGFIVVQIDGMGTANRSKAFHDVCWHNLKDAGFPDRISWMRAAKEKFPSMDLSRVGIYGTSAGGQNAMGALLFHGDFYKAAMASCGCHDNRMDKASWNEQWMGYPVGPHYAQSSNVDNADRLKGDLLLMVGELDTNVPPESTLRVVDALIDANKQFEFLMIPGMGHSSGGRYGWEKTKDFFKQALQPEPHMSIDSQQQAPTTPTAEELSDIESISSWSVIRRQYEADLGSLNRQYPLRISPVRCSKLEKFFDQWDRALPSLVADDDEPDSDDEYVSLTKSIAESRQEVDQQREQSEKLIGRAPVLSELIDLCHLGHRGESLDYPNLAERLEGIRDELKQLDGLDGSDWRENLRRQYADWKTFYRDYDPQFDWWCADIATEIEKRLNQEPPESAGQSAEPVAATAGDSQKSSPVHSAWAEFPDDYPAQWQIQETADVFMPSIIRKFRSEGRRRNATDDDGQKESTSEQITSDWLRGWRTALTDLQRPNLAFEDWQVCDQIDYHLLLREIDTRLAKIESKGGEPVIAKSSDGSGIEGVVVGRERLLLELADQFIGDDPERLIELAEQGLQETHEEMISVANQMGYGDDWQAAVNHMKNAHVEAGKQPKLIRETAEESIQFLRDHDWITIDRLAETSWRMQMMSPERQLVNPFFTGGETISISFPTSQMTSSEKRQSLRGNNLPFVRTTVHHELIPGHHLQQYQTARYQTHRRPFGTPFWLEGWAVYWEFMLYENGFPRTPKEQMGFLVWRAHRYARIIFSLRFHLGQMSPDQCTDFLVQQVGFDRLNSAAEVRRSVGPDYPPLYQAAYMVGAMQLRQLADEWTAAGRPIKEFHDAATRQGSLPISLLRAALWNEPIDRENPPLMTFTVQD